MKYKALDMNAYARVTHFNYFRAMANPYVGTTVQADITDFYRAVKEKGRPVFLSTLYAVSRAANAVPEFRQRIAGEGIIEYEWCRTSHTVALPDGTYRYCTLDARAPLAEFIETGRREQEQAKRAEGLAEDENDLLFVSCVPWLSYTSLVQPTPSPADSNPRLTWGRIEEKDGRVTMPLTVLAHHALVDGLQIGQFYRAFGVFARPETVCD